jgi:hypothetical protein
LGTEEVDRPQALGTVHRHLRRGLLGDFPTPTWLGAALDCSRPAAAVVALRLTTPAGTIVSTRVG